jgi:predicted GIY-YIG superfamily endonuclease
MPTDYKNSQIYKIYCKDENVKDIYIGITTDFIRRKQAHKHSCNTEYKQYKTSRYTLYQAINSNGGWNNWAIEVIENFPCENKKQLLDRETFWITELNATLNKSVRKSTKEYKKEWYNQHRDTVRIKQKEYQDAMKALYTIDFNNLENNPQWFRNNVLNSSRKL